ncbi:hypothetical protein [Alysiella filiformis]|uniref:Uncharacterized protein n=1 Tax=Alysiella filiformis DSM 16848 TaxID=1120981 RepID=A0A286E1J3_9NEIS|nr:hypothetical protein [Alysiella filiformis]QMT30756.1 hypothetical protein H3L97_08390 [Alysiella filiformis]UBQ56264.1 hypothetical protein JF568_00295 [Alysiella filiformis DSM 16848]SOD64777.1 hypothetical protein SAMN02746062_00029 [Alysiella filiformis DSM 16848]
MATRVKVYVFQEDNKGKMVGKEGVKVSTNHMPNDVKTDSSGAASLIIEEDHVKIFVANTKIYDGFTSACPSILECEWE